MGNLVNFSASGAQAFQWTSLITPILTLVGILASVVVGLNTARRNLRANILGASRLKWLEQLRDEIANLLIHGERLYPGADSINIEMTASERNSLMAASKKLVVLLGREDPQRLALAEVVRKFAAAPDKQLAEEIEVLSQRVFRMQWNKVRTETGGYERETVILERPGKSATEDQTPAEATSLSE